MIGVVSESGHQNHLSARARFLGDAEDFVAIAFRHTDVADHYVVRLAFSSGASDGFASFITGREPINGTANFCKHVGNNIAHWFFIIKYREAPSGDVRINTLAAIKSVNPEHHLWSTGCAAHAILNAGYRSFKLGNGGRRNIWVALQVLDRTTNRSDRRGNLIAQCTADALIGGVALDHQHVQNVQRHSDVATKQFQAEQVLIIKLVGERALHIDDANYFVMQQQRGGDA